MHCMGHWPLYSFAPGPSSLSALIASLFLHTICSMAQLLTPPTSRAGSEFPDSKASTECLDELLERYLCLLDQQQKLQSELAKHLSSGFFALAQANFTCPPGRRYGADYYDERMKATRRMLIKPEQESNASTECSQGIDGTSSFADSTSLFSVELSSSSVPGDTSENDSEASQSPQKSEPEASEESTAGETTSSGSSEHGESSTQAEKPEARKKFHSTDPIHWYGILVPQSLRKAQASFTAVIDDQVPDLASTTIEMRALEQQIRKLQVQLEPESGEIRL